MGATFLGALILTVLDNPHIRLTEAESLRQMLFGLILLALAWAYYRRLPHVYADLDELCADVDVVHAICFNVRVNPALHEAREMVRQGDLGRTRLVSGGYLEDWLLLDTD